MKYILNIVNIDKSISQNIYYLNPFIYGSLSQLLSRVFKFSNELVRHILNNISTILQPSITKVPNNIHSIDGDQYLRRFNVIH